MQRRVEGDDRVGTPIRERVAARPRRALDQGHGTAGFEVGHQPDGRANAGQGRFEDQNRGIRFPEDGEPDLRVDCGACLAICRELTR